MTHFTVLVCASGPGQVESLLAPYDENMDVDPRRDYEEGEAKDHWHYLSLKEAFDNSLQKPEGEDPNRDARARLFLECQFSDPPTWAQVARALNEEYPPDSGEREMLVDEDFPGGPRAYTMTTYNPDSKWDWYQVGGRWSGSFTYKAGHADEVLNADKGRSESGFGFDPPTISPLHCDGGPKRALDLEATRAEAEARARENAAKFATLTRGTPPIRPWGEFRDRVSEVGYTLDQARKDYHSQPGVVALEDSDFRWADNPEKFQRPVEEQVAEARAKAILGYALLRQDGTWLEPGQRGWFAMSDSTDNSRALYREAANDYVNGLPDDAWLIMVDCHI